MDCKTARLLLDYARPAVAELDAADSQDLQNHLSDCPDCAALERTERAVDSHLGRAMRSVPISEGLRDRLVARLNAQRDAWYRRMVLKFGSLGVAASILVGIAIWFLVRPHPQEISLHIVHRELTEREQLRPEEVAEGFRRMGVETTPPPNFNYFFLSTYELTVFKEKQVPALLFRRDGQYARVFILDGREFNLESLKTQSPVTTGRLTVEVHFHPSKASVAYLVEYTGGSLEPFLVRDSGPLACLSLDLSLSSPMR